MNNKQWEEDSFIGEILKPFAYQKYGKIYIGYEETEGALRIEGLILKMKKKLSQREAEIRKETIEKVIKLIMEDYAEHTDCCDYVNGLLNKIDKI